MCPKELMLTKPMSVLFCHYLLKINFKFGPVSIKGDDYRTHVWYISKDETIDFLRNFNLTEKTGTL